MPALLTLLCFSLLSTISAVSMTGRMGVAAHPRVLRTHAFAMKDAEPNEEREPSPERAAFERGEGRLFFQSPTPLTGEQEGMVDFFSKENFAASGEIPLQGKVVIGVAGALSLWLLVSLILA
eukprot:scaffold314306_cov43-Tisochrysis_lutea.AAC.2